MVRVKLPGRYHLESKIADGGIATVWRATDEVLGRTVAAKILHNDLAEDDAIRECFQIEALAAARLTHPNIVAIYDTGGGDGPPFIVMEYLEGGTLRQVLDREGRLDVGRAAWVGTQVAAALEHAHVHGVVHRNIKPTNILFTEAGHVKVTDFGIARAAFGPIDLTGDDTFSRAVRYLSPEQVRGQEPDHRSDLYSLGLVLHESLTGGAGANLLPVTQRRRIGGPRLRSVRPDVPRRLDSVIARALAPSPADRFATAADIRGTLAPFVHPDATNRSAPDLRARSVQPIPATVTPSGPGGPATGADFPPEGASARPNRTDPPPSFVKTEGRWLLPALLGVVLVAGVILVTFRSQIVTSILPPKPAPGLTIGPGGAFDPPPGDERENDEDVARAFDGDSATVWSTQSYATETFGELKAGVGLWFKVSDPGKLEGLRVSSVSGGWSALLRHSDDGRTWSPPVGPAQQIGPDSLLRTQERHAYWMIWITRLTETRGEGTQQNPYSVAIREVQPLAR